MFTLDVQAANKTFEHHLITESTQHQIKLRTKNFKKNIMHCQNSEVKVILTKSLRHIIGLISNLNLDYTKQLGI